MTISAMIPTAARANSGKIVQARDAVRLIRSGDTVAISGFAGIGIAETVVHALADHYRRQPHR